MPQVTPLAAGIVYQAGGSVLLLLRAPTAGEYPMHWALPAGHIEDGETPEQAAIRESCEEIAHTPTEPLGLLDEHDGFVAYAVTLDAPFAPVLNDEHIGYLWAPLNALPQPLHPGCVRLFALLAATVAMDAEKWVTVENGEHVLLGEGGEIKGGLGGKGQGQPISKLKNAPAKASVKSEFSSSEKAAIDAYSSDETKPSEGRFKPAYQEINGGLRADGKPPKQHAETVKKMDKAFETAEVGEPFTTYRGVSKDFADKLTAGKTFTDKGFTSTTSDIGVAKEFTGAGGVLMHISVPAGARALSLEKVSKYPNEKEVLLNRGGKYKVKSDTKDDRGNRVIHVEYQG